MFWLGGALNQLGSHASGLALPVLVLALGGSALTAGLLGTVGAVAEVALAPIAGVFADRHPRRGMLLVALLVAAAATGAIGIGVATRAASLPLLFAAAVVQGAATAGYQAAANGAIRAILPADRPERALGALQGREQAARLVGPAFGGGLYQLSAWAPFLADAVSYVAAAACVRSIRTELRPAGQPDKATLGFRREFAAGVEFLWRQPFLRFVTLWAGGLNLVFAALSLEIVLSARSHGVPAGSIGVVLSIAGGAGVLGAMFAPFVLGRLPPGVVVGFASWLVAAAVLPMAVLHSVWADGAVLGVVALLTPALSIVLQGRAVMLTPDRMQGRVGTVLGTFGEGTAALGPLLAGWLVRAAPPTLIALLFAAALVALAGYATANVGRLRAPAEPDPAPIPAEG